MITINSKVNQYRKPVSGSMVFVYDLKGTADELKEFKAVQGTNYREDEATKRPLWFSNTPLSVGTEVTPTRDKSRYIIQTDLEAEALKAAELEKAELAKLKALQTFSGLTPAEIVKLVMAA